MLVKGTQTKSLYVCSGGESRVFDKIIMAASASSARSEPPLQDVGHRRRYASEAPPKKVMFE